MNQQVEKQEESLWRFPEQGQSECGNAECKETQGKIGNEDEDNSWRAKSWQKQSNFCLMGKEKKKGEDRVRHSNVGKSGVLSFSR